MLQTPVDSPPAGERRHQIRVRARGEDGDLWWAARLQSGRLTGGASAQFTASPSTATGSWGFGAPHDGPAILAAHIEGQTTGVKVTEIYVDVDTREAPTFTAQVIDGSGAVNTTVTDTSTPSLRATAVDTDGLNVRQSRFWVTSGSTIVWDSGVVSGSLSDLMTSPLGNGSYVAHLMIWSTLGANTAYASDEETLAFTVSIGEVPLPNDPGVTPIEGTPFYAIEVCAPDVSEFDGQTGHVEVQRVDCVESENPTVTTIAMLGPLETDECATWVDYTIPRTGLGADCDHDAEQCCSYYRARTIGRINGSVVISAWSDVRDTGIPSGLIFMWPGTNASVPAGFERVTDLDGRYPKGVATASTQPGTLGGAASHTHILPSHVHTMNHFHLTSLAPSTGAATGVVNSGPNTAGATGVPATHTHTKANINTTFMDSATTTPVPPSVNNELSRLEVIFIESDGTPTGAPNGSLALTTEVSLTGWTDYANANGRFLKGAAPAGNGGATGVSALDNHTHAIPAHTHAGVAHTHPTQSAVSTVNASLALAAGATAVSGTHAHPMSVSSASTAALNSASGGTSGASSAGTNEPPFRQIRAVENTSGAASLPLGLIAAWRGSLGTIPGNWQLCDGTGGTPDLIGRYPKGATAGIGTAGGSSDPHSHTSPTHTHTAADHQHSVTVGAATGTTFNAQVVATVSVATSTHTHSGGVTNLNADQTGIGSSTSGVLADAVAEPLHEEVAFIQLVEPFTPEPEPAVFCLEWTADEHLLRTEGPDGPMWVPVGGTFTWDVERPFTSAVGVNGTRFVQNAEPGARNLTMTAAVESEAALNALRAVLARPLVLISPSDSTEVWGAPIGESVQIVKVGRIRQVTAEFIGTGPQPGPQVADI